MVSASRTHLSRDLWAWHHSIQIYTQLEMKESQRVKNRYVCFVDPQRSLLSRTSVGFTPFLTSRHG